MGYLMVFDPAFLQPCTLEVAGDDGETDLDGGFGETSPSHSPAAVAALPCSEDILDPNAQVMDWLVPFLELAQRLMLAAVPHAGGQADSPLVVG